MNAGKVRQRIVVLVILCLCAAVILGNVWYNENHRSEVGVVPLSNVQIMYEPGIGSVDISDAGDIVYSKVGDENQPILGDLDDNGAQRVSNIIIRDGKSGEESTIPALSNTGEQTIQTLPKFISNGEKVVYIERSQPAGDSYSIFMFYSFDICVYDRKTGLTSSIFSSPRTTIRDYISWNTSYAVSGDGEQIIYSCYPAFAGNDNGQRTVKTYQYSVSKNQTVELTQKIQQAFGYSDISNLALSNDGNVIAFVGYDSRQNNEVDEKTGYVSVLNLTTGASLTDKDHPLYSKHRVAVVDTSEKFRPGDTRFSDWPLEVLSFSPESESLFFVSCGEKEGSKQLSEYICRIDLNKAKIDVTTVKNVGEVFGIKALSDNRICFLGGESQKFALQTLTIAGAGDSSPSPVSGLTHSVESFSISPNRKIGLAVYSQGADRLVGGDQMGLFSP